MRVLAPVQQRRERARSPRAVQLGCSTRSPHSPRRPRCASSRARHPLRRVFPRFACAVKLNGNRKVTGTLRGFDQFLNIVLDESVDGATKESMGMVVIRGNSIMLLEPLERIA